MFPSLCHELTRNSRGNPICVLQSLPFSLQLSIHLGFLFFSFARLLYLSSPSQQLERERRTMILMTVFTKFFENLARPRASPLQQSVGPDYSVRVSLASVDNVNNDGGTVTSTPTWQAKKQRDKPFWSWFFVDKVRAFFSLSVARYSEYISSCVLSTVSCRLFYSRA